MNVIKCTNCGKFYDCDKFSLCPHCEEDIDVKNEKESDKEITKKSKRGLFGKKEKFDEDNIYSVPEHSVAKTFGRFSDDNYDENPSDDYEEDDNNMPEVPDGPNGFWSEETKDVEVHIDTSKDIMEERKEKVEPESKKVSEEPGSSSNNSLTQEITNITKNNSGRTLGYFSPGNSDESTKSVSNESTKHTSNVAIKPVVKVQSAPVVGWLVCTKGKHFGESFQLYDGNNSIGRGSSNDVVLYKEQSVSSNKHAIITYEPKKRYFLIQSGDSHGLTYLNDELVTTPQKIEIYSSIEFGESAFTFIPLCGEHFSWEEYIGR